MSRQITRGLALIVVVCIGFAFAKGPDSKRLFDITKNIEIFTTLYGELNTFYVDDLDPNTLMKTGIDAMMGSLDPYTVYYSESQIEGYRFQNEGRYHGLGVKSKVMGDYVTIIELHKDSPADKAGLKIGDQFSAVNGESAKGRSVEELTAVLQGVANTSVDLTVLRPGSARPVEVTLTRGNVEVPNVPYSGMVSDDIGYINLTVFTQRAGKNVSDALKQLKGENPNLKGIILDLRSNGGGLLAEAVNVSNVFVPKGELIVSTKGKVKEWDRSFSTNHPVVDGDIPLVVLINNRSASASEIVSGVVQDYDRGVLIGQRSYGKGLVQNTKDLAYNTRLKLTTAKYYIPSQRCIQSVEYKDGEPVDIPDDQRGVFYTRAGRKVLDGGGVSPDIQVALPSDVPIIKALEDQHLIFDFVSQYALRYDSIESVEAYKFQDYAEFLSFLDKGDFDFKTESETAINELTKVSEEEGFALGSQLSALRAAVQQDKQVELQKHQSTIEALIEKEIAGRFHYQRGQIEMSLRHDAEIKDAIAVLRDKARYEQILSKQ